MKIISGTAKGRDIKIPKNSSTLEPVKGVVKLAIFNILGDKIKDAACLDLYAGSGSLGLEAISRGAKDCLFVESENDCVHSMQESLNLLNFLENGEVIRGDVSHYVESQIRQFDNMTICQYDIIFLDPPYITPTTHLLKRLPHLLKEGGIVVYLCGSDRVIENLEGLEIIKEKKYGKTKVVICRRVIPMKIGIQDS